MHALTRLADEGARSPRLRASDRSLGDGFYEIWRAALELHMAVSCIG